MTRLEAAWKERVSNISCISSERLRPKFSKKSERGFMERFLVALDCMPGCTKIIDYIVKVLSGAQTCEFVIFHVLATESPDKLRRGEVERIEKRHSARPDLGGYFWKGEDEEQMTRCFAEAKEKLVLGGFAPESVSCSFGIESGYMADIILAKAAELRCSTIVLGRRRLSRVKEFLIGSVSSTIIKLARGSAVWVIDI
jgi:nucleotide-binding universal stress UspA family protein